MTRFGAEASRLEAALRVKRVQPVERRRREQVNDRAVEEGARRQRLLGQDLLVREPVDVRPVLLEARRLGRRGCEADVPAEHVAERLAEIALLARHDRRPGG